MKSLQYPEDLKRYFLLKQKCNTNREIIKFTKITAIYYIHFFDLFV